jgi:phosphoribosylformylglycinamidine synthase PurS subunit
VRATVLVRPKPGILDPQGQAVESSLRHLGFAIGPTRVGRLIDIEIPTEDRGEALAALAQMCEQLLTNPLIEGYHVELDGVPVDDADAVAGEPDREPNLE